MVGRGPCFHHRFRLLSDILNKAILSVISSITNVSFRIDHTAWSTLNVHVFYDSMAFAFYKNISSVQHRIFCGGIQKRLVPSGQSYFQIFENLGIRGCV
uniref:Uncharacterized protein n=1 Tax=Physcomitrium patens TaxID=3218 RepID=A0A2K1IJX9_PHYPA|nr:hypothetical protein PHYPA_028278 [Physcomitrium patens]